VRKKKEVDREREGRDGQTEEERGEIPEVANL
jgi:hypothetical protein